MEVLSKYLSHTVGFSGAVPKAIFSEYFMYMLAITGENSELIGKLSSCWYMSDSSWEIFFCTQNFNISIRLPIGTLVHSPRCAWILYNRASSIEALVKRLTKQIHLL